MDSEILDARLSAAETAILKLDERINTEGEGGSDEQAPTIAGLEARIISLEASHSECIAQLQTTQTSLSEALARIAEAQAQEAQAEADAAEAIAEALTSEQEALEPETAERMIVDLEPEPESEGDVPESSRSSWWENLFALR